MRLPMIYLVTEDINNSIYAYGVFDSHEKAEALRSSLVQEDAQRIINIIIMELNSTHSSGWL